LIELAKLAVFRSEGSEALALAEEALGVYRSMGALASEVEIANAITGIGYSLKELNRVEEATKALDEAIAILHEGGFPFVVDTMRTKASWLAEIEKYEAAIATYLEIVQINEINGEKEFVGRDLYQVAHCFQKLGRWSESIVHAERARENLKCKAKELVAEIGWCDLMLADSYVELQNAEIAFDYAQRGYDIGTLRKHGAMICKAAFIIGKIHVVKAEFDLAEARFQEARNLVAGADDWEVVQKIEKEMMNLYLVQGRVNDAKEIERQLNSLKEVIG
jgi:tetratricopeptide (TPR) repeat protein